MSSPGEKIVISTVAVAAIFGSAHVIAAHISEISQTFAAKGALVSQSRPRAVPEHAADIALITTSSILAAATSTTATSTPQKPKTAARKSNVSAATPAPQASASLAAAS